MRSKNNVWFPFFVNDWMGDTPTFTSTQHGLYLQMICLYWNNKGPILFDKERLHKMSMLNKRTFNKEFPEVLEKFTVEDGKLHHKRVDIELAKLVDLKEKRSKGGKAGAKKRWADSQQQNDNTCHNSVIAKGSVRVSDSDSDCSLTEDSVYESNGYKELAPSNRQTVGGNVVAFAATAEDEF